MKIKLVVFLMTLFTFSQADCYYMNDRKITWKTVLTGDAATSIDYNSINNGSGEFGGDIRTFGIHNMWVQVSGYERIDLVKNDVCLYPHLFTMLGYVLPKDNMFTQRWACVKWFLPLSFGFKIENDMLHVTSTIFKYRFICLFRSSADIALVKQDGSDINEDNHVTITVSINGRSAVVEPKTIVQVYRSFILEPSAILLGLLLV